MASSDSDSSADKKKRKDKKEKKSKKDKKKKEKKSKKEKRRRDDDDAPSAPAGPPPAEQLTDGDYFSKSAEFRAWLRDARDLFLDDIEADAARKHFATFVERWNTGRLGADYYDGSVASRGGKRTKHVWSFKLDDSERRGLASTRAAISRETRKDDPTMIRQFAKTEETPGAFARPAGRMMLAPRDAESDRLKAELMAKTGGKKLLIAPRKPGE
mmetsp:Transcript_30262/g.90703  ORF Transcript_30262/g.90703 Transcript_30262/m.90703 type:complete len:214 (-) Transcript_30262:30-671(-)